LTRPSTPVLAIAVVDEFSVAAARQGQIARERLARIERAVACLTVAIGPAGILT